MLIMNFVFFSFHVIRFDTKSYIRSGKHVKLWGKKLKIQRSSNQVMYMMEL